MSSSSEEDVKMRPIPSEFREWSRDRLPKQLPSEVVEQALLIKDDELRSHYLYRYLWYQDLSHIDADWVGELPSSFVKTKWSERFIALHGTHTGADALHENKEGIMQFLTGLVGYQKDVSGMQVLMNLQQMIRNTPVVVGYIYALMGFGKSDFALLIWEVFVSVYGRDGVYLVSNMEVQDQDEKVIKYSRLLELLEDRRGDDNEKELVIIIDEAAQLFTGTGKDQHRGKKLAKLLKLARKSDAHILMIGQDGKDIDASLRALCTMFIEKLSKKKAVFWRDVKNRQGYGEIMSLSGIPPTNWEYDTKDEGDLIFDVEEEDWEQQVSELEAEIKELEEKHERMMMAVLNATREEHGMEQSDIGEIYGVSDRTVRNWYNRYEDDLAEMGIV